ncbi:MAG: tetratricopeptide repeat protein, partial [Candidatus Omnitrophica bacterium]|nr:tetratricopeptide repeat protein [Candidatus Omnitrophota bacterium]
DDKSPPELLAKAKLAIAEIFSQDADLSVGVQAYLDILKKTPELRRSVYIKIAEIYEKNKQHLQALEAYQTALAAEQSLSEVTNVEIQFAIGDVYESLRQREKAIEAYLKISYLYPKDLSWVIKAYLRVARIFEEQEKWEEARSAYQKILEFETEESKYAEEQLERLKEK